MVTLYEEGTMPYNKYNIPSIDSDSTIESYRSVIENELIATREEIQLVMDINGYSKDTLNAILKVRTGFDNWSDYYNTEIKPLYSDDEEE